MNKLEPGIFRVTECNVFPSCDLCSYWLSIYVAGQYPSLYLFPWCVRGTFVFLCDGWWLMRLVFSCQPWSFSKIFTSSCLVKGCSNLMYSHTLLGLIFFLLLLHLISLYYSEYPVIIYHILKHFLNPTGFSISNTMFSSCYSYILFHCILLLFFIFWVIFWVHSVHFWSTSSILKSSLPSHLLPSQLYHGFLILLY